MRKRKVLLIGPMPPPSGGVSVHLARILQKSFNHPQLSLAVFDLRKMKFYNAGGKKKNFFAGMLYFFSAHIVHIHLSGSIKLPIAQVCKRTGKKVFYTQHNPRELPMKSTQEMIRLCNRTIFVFNPGKIYPGACIIPAYIAADNQSDLPDGLEMEIKNYTHVLVSCSSYSGRLNEEKDIYGFDTILEAVSKIVFPERTILILVDSAGILKKRYEKIIPSVELKAGLKIILTDEEINFPKLLSIAGIFIRATISEGDALSVREALQAGANVLASDCTARPDGCVLFRSGDAGDLLLRLSELMKNYSRKIFNQHDFAGDIFNLYLHADE